MPSENDLYDRFNDSIVPVANYSVLWRGIRGTAPNMDARVRRQSRPYWRAGLQGCKLNEPQKEELLYLIWRSKGVKPVLCRVPMFCEIGSPTTARDEQGYIISTPSLIGVGDGTEDVYQLRKPIINLNRPDENFYYDVIYPHTGEYPTQKNVSANDWTPLSPLQLWRFSGGVWLPLASNLWSVDRNTGLATATVTGNLGATGGFYILMLLPDDIQFGNDPEHRGIYQITNGVELYEPPGGK